MLCHTLSVDTILPKWGRKRKGEGNEKGFKKKEEREGKMGVGERSELGHGGQEASPYVLANCFGISQRKQVFAI